ncbi:hypothetical protein GCM10007315_14480 [Gemmobacter tilapiae]|uniref:DUF4279 domain-containing protein n=1 Tax=Neogemmobacter tilapiae TaxID=875041 RepID=A0A918TL62_9RHOB|nr:hypothetical protein GCM10007315_14480 [Gemmobacter tilapiae]
MPEELTILLGKNPSDAYRKGEELPTPLGNRRAARTGYWGIAVARKEPADLDAQIAEILDGMTDDLGVWQELANRFQLEIFCGLFLKEFNEGLSISAATTALLGARGISLDFDIYYKGDD